jgi:NAD(P)-dependent dehydrogenase (short-subunit alcohol dehydrogenase family)
MARLTGKVAAITGGGAGIGLATDKFFVREAAVDIRADVTKPDQVEHYVQTAVDRYGGIGVFIANAGILSVVKPLMGILVNIANPSAVETEMGEVLAEDFVLGARGEGNRALEAGTPLKRLGRPEEVAQTMLFLGSEESGYWTGGVFGIDGGRSAL